MLKFTLLPLVALLCNFFTIQATEFNINSTLSSTMQRVRIDCTTPTGFDSEINETVSTSSNEIILVNTYFNFLNGENNYALAA